MPNNKPSIQMTAAPQKAIFENAAWNTVQELKGVSGDDAQTAIIAAALASVADERSDQNHKLNDDAEVGEVIVRDGTLRMFCVGDNFREEWIAGAQEYLSGLKPGVYSICAVALLNEVKPSIHDVTPTTPAPELEGATA